MNAVWLDVPEHFLEERRRLGLDKKDELWDGVIHMVPPPASRHHLFAMELQAAFRSMAKRRGLIVCGEGAGLFSSVDSSNYRVADAALVRPEQISERGLEGAELVVEVLSPNDESRAKLPFYLELGVREMWLIDPKTRATEIFALIAGAYVPVAFDHGIARSPVLSITLEVIDGPLLRLRDGGDVAEI